jgi:preprotein translocase subunit YajC
MNNVRKLLFGIGFFVFAVALFFVSRKMRKSSKDRQKRLDILETARETKKMKSILKEEIQENEN